MLERYFKRLYWRTMDQAYARALAEARALPADGVLLDCGANDGNLLDRLASLPRERYVGIEWNAAGVAAAKARGLDVRQGDLNALLPYESDRFATVIGLSVLEHLLNPCRFLNESRRVLRPGGRLVLLTPNISTYFTAALILLGKMPSSGPHPDSDALLESQDLFRVNDQVRREGETDRPLHRHLVVFSFRVLRDYLRMLGFREVRGYGFGLYPFPNFMQPVLERIDPWHCHQMVFVATK